MSDDHRLTHVAALLEDVIDKLRKHYWDGGSKVADWDLLKQALVLQEDVITRVLQISRGIR